MRNQATAKNQASWPRKEPEYRGKQGQKLQPDAFYSPQRYKEASQGNVSDSEYISYSYRMNKVVK
jgi:hypothetical protein